MKKYFTIFLLVLFIIGGIESIFIHDIADISYFSATKRVHFIENPDHEI